MMAKLANCEGAQWYGTFWAGRKRVRVGSFVSDGIVHSEDVSGEDDYEFFQKLEDRDDSPLFQRVKDIGYQPLVDNTQVQAEMITRCLLESDGKPIEYFDDLIRKKVKNLTVAREQRLKERNQELYRRFPGAVIGLDKDIDVYDSGFSVRVLLKTGMTKDTKRRFVKDNKKDLVRATMNDLTGLGSFKRKIGSLSYYRPCEIVVLNAEELEVKFEVKREVV